MNRSEARIVELFLANVSAKLNPRQASAAAGLSYAAAYEAMAALAAENVLNRERVGIANVYGVNPQAEAAREALMVVAAEKRRKIYGAGHGLEDALKKTVERVRQELPDARSIVLFGSVARQEAKKESDVDLLFILPAGKKLKAQSRIVGDICATKSIETSKAISPVVLSTEEFERMLKSRERNLAKEVVRGGVPVFGAENYFDLVLGCLQWKESII